MYTIRAEVNGVFYNAGQWRNKRVAALLCYLKNSRIRRHAMTSEYVFFEVVKEQ